MRTRTAGSTKIIEVTFLIADNLDVIITGSVDIDTLSPIGIKFILGEGSKGELRPVADACETLIIACQ